MAHTFSGAEAVLRDQPAAVLDDWIARYQASPVRVPGPVDRRALAAPARGIVAALALALAEPGAGPGTTALREVEKLFAFAGGAMGVAAQRAFDAVAFAAALRDSLLARTGGAAEADALRALFDWLGAVAVEGYATSRVDAVRLRHRDQLERGTPVVLVTPELPAAFLVAEPERSVLDIVFGRLLLLVVRVDPGAVIIDGGGLTAPVAPPLLEALAVLAGDRRMRRLTTILSSLPPAAEPEWTAVFPPGARVECAERFDGAVARALEVVRHA